MAARPNILDAAEWTSRSRRSADAECELQNKPGYRFAHPGPAPHVRTGYDKIRERQMNLTRSSPDKSYNDEKYSGNRIQTYGDFQFTG
jgi:hypothetical protein